MNPLPVHNHETTFVTLARELFQLTPFEWQRRVGSTVLLTTFSKRPTRLLCVQSTGGGKTLLPIPQERVLLHSVRMHGTFLIEKAHDCLMLSRQSAFEPNSEG